MTSPTDRVEDKEPPSFVRDDGRWEHKFRQSWLKTLDHCPEQARADRADELPPQDTDAAVLGTAVHDAIELCLDDVMAYGTPMHLGDMQDAAQQFFTEAMAKPGFVFVKSTEATSRKHIDMALAAWHERVLPDLAPVATEVTFDVVVYEDEKRVIRVKGTADYLDKYVGLMDWKTSGEPYSREKWKYERYDVQSTIYTFALHELGWLPEQEQYPFTFCVMVKGKSGPQAIDEVTVLRTPQHWKWLQNKVLSAALLVEAQLPQWPMGESDWWCSPKWCPKFDSCKGLLLGERRDVG